MGLILSCVGPAWNNQFTFAIAKKVFPLALITPFKVRLKDSFRQCYAGLHSWTRQACATSMLPEEVTGILQWWQPCSIWSRRFHVTCTRFEAAFPFTCLQVLGFPALYWQAESMPHICTAGLQVWRTCTVFYLIVNLVVLLCQIQSSVAIAVVVVILMQISAMALSSLKRVIPKHLKLFTSSSCTLFSDSLKPRSKGFSYFIPILLELLSWDGVNARCCPSLQTVYHALDLFL